MKLVIKKTGYLEITQQKAADLHDQISKLVDMAHLQSLASLMTFEELDELDRLLIRIASSDKPKPISQDVK